MTYKYSNLCFLIFQLLLHSQAHGKLEFDAKKNGAQLFGPFVKYNVLKEPYSFGRYLIDRSDIRVEVRKPEKADEQRKLIALWPQFLIQQGEISLVNLKKEVLVVEDFDSENTGSDDKYASHTFDIDTEDILTKMTKGFFFCVLSKKRTMLIKICSDKMILNKGRFETLEKSNHSKAVLNGKKVPRNAQINLPKTTQKINLLLQFRSGFKIRIIDQVRPLNIDDVAIDPKEKKISIIDRIGSSSQVKLTFKNQFFNFLKEKNYYKKRIETQTSWPQSLEDVEMEFAPYNLGAEAQLFGIILDKLPPPSLKVKIDDEAPVATYQPHLELKGTKAPSERVVPDRTGKVKTRLDKKAFIWKTLNPTKGTLNTSYLGYKDKDKTHYFSNRIFRAHKSSVSLNGALSTTTEFSVALGYQITAEHWFESLFSKSSWSFQRWGVGLTAFENIDFFEIKNKRQQTNSVTRTEKFRIREINLDFYYRFSKGVRPIQSTFGLVTRLSNLQLFRKNREDLTPRFLGVGAFWHTAPPKIVDDVFSVVPFFRYPKWMKLSAFYYPVVSGDFKIDGFSLGWNLNGRMYFKRNWFFETSLNVNVLNLRLEDDSEFDVFTMYGTLGLGYLF